MPNVYPTSELARHLGEALNVLLNERGFSLPLHFACIGSNGAIFAGSYVQDDGGPLRCEFVAEHVPREGVRLPVNFMFCDASGQAARVVIERDGRRVLQ